MRTAFASDAPLACKRVPACPSRPQGLGNRAVRSTGLRHSRSAYRRGPRAVNHRFATGRDRASDEHRMPGQAPLLSQRTENLGDALLCRLTLSQRRRNRPYRGSDSHETGRDQNRLPVLACRRSRKARRGAELAYRWTARFHCEGNGPERGAFTGPVRGRVFARLRQAPVRPPASNIALRHEPA
jgi:hypothetical protein